MATKKISELTAIAEADNSDVLPIVDVSEGTTKKITKGNLLVGAGHTIEMTIDTNYRLVLKLKNETGTVLSTQTLDLPSENAVTGITYSNGSLTVTKQSGATSQVDITGLIEGLVTETALNNLANALKAVIGISTNTYDSTQTYNTGDIVIQSEKIYKANQDNITGTFDNTKWDEISLYEYQKMQDELIEENYKVTTKLQEKVATLRKIISQNPQVTDTGYEPILADTIKAPFTEFEVKGHSEQETTEGKNKLDISAENVEYISVQGTPTIIFDGKGFDAKMPNAYCGLFFYVKATPNIQYTFSWNTDGKFDNIRVFKLDKSTELMRSTNAIGSANLTTDEDGFYVRFYFVHNLNAKLNYAMVRLATITDDTYEPFTGGQPAPSPSYPYPVKSCGDNVNELENTATTQTVNGVKFTINEDGTVLVNGTATALATITLATNPDFEGEAILSGCPDGGSDSKYFIQYSDNVSRSYKDFGNGIKVQHFTGTNSVVVIAVRSGVTVNNLLFKPKLEQSTKATPYSPYGMGCMNEKIESRNIFNPNNALVKNITNFEINNILSQSDNTDISISSDNYIHGKSSNYIVICSRYTFIKGKTIYNNGYKGSRPIIIYDNTGKVIETTAVRYIPTETFEGYIGIGINANDTNADGKYIMFSYDENATYSQYMGEQTISIPTQQPMMDDDYFDRENNEEVHTWQKIVLDGSSDENWSSNNIYFKCTSADSSFIKYNNWIENAPVDSNKVKCNIGVVSYQVLDGQTGFGLALAYGVRINLENIDASNGGTAEQLRAYLAENPITVYVKFKESAYEKLPFTQEQIDAFNEVDEAYSYKGGTYISSEDEVKARIKVSGLKDLNVMFENLTNAIISQGANT